MKNNFNKLAVILVICILGILVFIAVNKSIPAPEEVPIPKTEIATTEKRPKKEEPENVIKSNELTEKEANSVLRNFNDLFIEKEKWVKSQEGYINVDKNSIEISKNSNIFTNADVDYVENLKECNFDSLSFPYVEIYTNIDKNEKIKILLDATAKYFRGKYYGFIRVQTNKVNTINALKKANTFCGQAILGIIKIDENTFDVYTVEDCTSFDTVRLFEKAETKTIQETITKPPETTAPPETTTIPPETTTAPKPKKTSGGYEEEPEE